MDPRTLDLLTPPQRQVLDAVFAEEALRRSFYLTGGTALAAFYLFHRYSDDLDLFTNERDIAFLWPALQGLQPTLQFTVESRTPRFIRLQCAEGLRVDFVQDVPFRVGVPVSQGSWQVDSLENLTLNKITAIQGRLDAKDYVDLYLLLKDRPKEILRLLEEAKRKDASVDPFLWSRIIGDVETLRVLPRMITPVTLGELTKFYQALRRQILTALKPTAS